MRVNLFVVFRRSAVGVCLASLRVGPFMRRIVVQIHVAGVRILCKNAFIKLTHFLKLIHVLSEVNEVFIHEFASQFDHFDILVTHMQEDRYAHNYKTTVDSEHIP